MSEEKTPAVDPAEYIARNWYKDMALILGGVNFGEVMMYDALQVVNRAVIAQTEEESKETK